MSTQIQTRWTGLIFSIVLLLLSCSGAPVYAQHWQHLSLPTMWSGPGGVFFLNEDYGFVFQGWGHGNPRQMFYRTRNGCRTWDSVLVPCPNSSENGPNAELFFLSPSHLLLPVPASVGHASIGEGIYESLDSGSTWRRITPDSVGCEWAYGSGDTVLASIWAYNDGHGGSDGSTTVYRRSTNDGVTWTDTYPGVGGQPRNGILGSRSGVLSIVDLQTGASVGTGMTAVSTNAGSSWRRGSATNPVNMDSRFLCWMKPNSSTIFLAQNLFKNFTVTGAIIWRSTDYGLTFQQVDSIGGHGLGAEIEGVAGNDCAPVYIENDEGVTGFVRTTDAGATWQNIMSPTTNYWVHSYSVIGRGAIVYALAADGMLWKTTDGGDGLLNSSVLPLITTNFSKSNSDTITTTLCDSLSLEFIASFAGCDRVWIDSASIDSIAPNRYYTVLTNRALTNGSSPDTARLYVIAEKAGTYPITVHGRLRREDWKDEDTSIHLILNVLPNPGILNIVSNRLHDFGTQSLCHPVSVRDSFSLSAHGCQQVVVDSIVLHPITGAVQDFSFKAVRNIIPPDSGAAVFPITYKPSTAQTDSGLIVIYYFDGERHQTDTIIVRGAGVADSRTFVLLSNSISSAMCDSTQCIVTIRNPACGALEVDSVSLPAGIELLSRLPIVLNPGDSSSLQVRVLPGTEGSPLAALHLGDTTLLVTLHARYGPNGFDTIMALQIHIGRGNPLSAISPVVLDFDTVTTCETRTRSVALASVGCDTLSNIVCRLGSGDKFSITQSPSTPIPTGFDDSISLSFHSDIPNGLSRDTLFITTNAGTKTIPLSAFTVSGSVALGLTDTAFTFSPVIAACGVDSLLIGLTNGSCRAIILDSLVGIVAPFERVPFGGDTIPSQGTDSLRVRYRPELAGNAFSHGRLYFHGQNGVEHDTSIALYATALNPPSLEVYLKAQALTAGPTGTV
ncbi:MAG: hypothetical protein Q8922_05005 [Bacteroidota bacterium]|nr:hypothetical protein [Bacteroidota bacterium]